ncbi:hypothetical protein H4R34_001363 [Dimargaris verticillata]|uniref:Transmembrane protein 242 n=1 Tax=Dimargaris verticillata TaxID=2761393 RepID=A0A9W8EEJ8_9FUNG|nr:hypothetical protein H4R34_001363 [Dimargaris verticillata]
MSQSAEPPLTPNQLLGLSATAFSTGLAGYVLYSRGNIFPTSNSKAAIRSRTARPHTYNEARRLAFRSLGIATTLTFTTAGLAVLVAGTLTGSRNMAEFSTWLQEFATTNLRSLKTSATAKAEASGEEDSEDWSQLLGPSETATSTNDAPKSD